MPDQVREVYERAIANVPPGREKRYWQRYIFLWVRYALWEELDAGNPERTREVYRTCLGLIPHSNFTFAKVHRPLPRCLRPWAVLPRLRLFAPSPCHTASQWLRFVGRQSGMAQNLGLRDGLGKCRY